MAVDVCAMAEIHAASFAPPFGTGGWDALEMSAHLQQDLCFGTGEPLGAFIILRRATDQAEILTLATAPAKRRTGLARELLVTAVEELAKRGVREVFLEVAEDNAAAQALYRATGFSTIGRRPAYYRRPQGRIAALTFSKKLDGTTVPA